LEKRLPDLENAYEKSQADLQATATREAEITEEVCTVTLLLIFAVLIFLIGLSLNHVGK
jgi:hypothetical protein